MNNANLNPQGVIIKTGHRHINMGKILYGSLPRPWIPLLDDESSPIRLLLNWVWDTEWKMFNSAVTEEHYLRMVEQTCEGAIEVDQEIKAQRVGHGMVHPAHPAFPLSQILTYLMQFCKKTPYTILSESILFVTCGMMNLEPPWLTPHMVREGPISDQRTHTCFRLLKWIFPDPFEDGKGYVCQELLQFGYVAEREVWLRAESHDDYLESILHVQRELQEFRTIENEHFNQWFPPLPVMPFDNRVYNYVPPLPQLDEVYQGEEEEGEEGEEVDEEEEEEFEVEDEEEMEEHEVFQQF